MTTAFLLGGHRIEVEALLRDSTLNPSAFSFVVADSETTTGVQVTRLEYDGADPIAFFQFDLFRDAHYAVYSWDGPAQRQEHCTGPWPRQALHVARWLSHLADRGRRSGASRSHPGWQWSKHRPLAAPADPTHAR